MLHFDDESDSAHFPRTRSIAQQSIARFLCSLASQPDSSTMRGVLPMYSCCLRALAKQATSTSRQYVAAEAQTVDAVTTFTNTHRLFHSSPARAYSNPAASTPQASTSAASSSFPVHSSRATSSSSHGNGNDANAMHYQPLAEQVTSHLNTLLEGLQPPLAPELAMRMVTHKGSSSSTVTSSQHNTKLSLFGTFIHLSRCCTSLTFDSQKFPNETRPPSSKAVPSCFPTCPQFTREIYRFNHE